MAIRLLEIVVDSASVDEVREVLADHPVERVWQDELAGERTLFRLLVPAAETEAVSDELAARLEGQEGFRIISLRVEATIPALEDELQPEMPAAASRRQRVSREELIADLAESTRSLPVYLTMAALSSVVAAVGLLRDNVAIVIAAMVIAPLLGPNVRLALATTLADSKLGLRALRDNAAGSVAAFVIAFLIGVWVKVDPTATEIASRTGVGGGDIVLALAAGVAGVLAFTAGLPGTLIGVMVAVALVPPLVVMGLLLGAGHVGAAGGAGLLLATNVICVNLAAVATFLVQGVRPKLWWEVDRARRATLIAFIVWSVLLGALIGLIMLEVA